jgi:hypothetical protein
VLPAVAQIADVLLYDTKPVFAWRGRGKVNEEPVMSPPTRFCMSGQNVLECGTIYFKYEAYIT